MEWDIRSGLKTQMGEATMADHGTFYWNELMTRDPEKAKAFYAATLGWTFDAMPMAEGAIPRTPLCARSSIASSRWMSRAG